ncbi:MAG: hypothetical protein M1530_00530 [Candidatus Marsarchaeota archaeon]|nr:hypothetical protein [Candidatus Marsarchaeota archaeon]
MKPSIAIACLLLALPFIFAGASGGRGAECNASYLFNFTVSVDRAAYPGEIEVGARPIEFGEMMGFEMCNRTSDAEFGCRYAVCGPSQGFRLMLLEDKRIYEFDAASLRQVVHIGRNGAWTDEDESRNLLLAGIGAAVLVAACALACSAAKRGKKNGRK